MKRTLLVAATAIALSAPAVPHAHANPNWYTSHPTYVSAMTAADLVDYCRGDHSMQPSCAGYILGVFDVLALTGKICPIHNPALSTQVVAIAVKYFNDHPEKCAGSPAFLIGDSLEPVFPCDKTAGQ